MRVILLNLPWCEGGRLGVRAGSRWPFTSKPQEDGRIHYIPFPFFLAYATSLLKKENKQARLIDAVAAETSQEHFLTEVKAYNPGLMVIETSTPSFKNDLRITCALHFNSPGSKIVLCGPHASTFPEEILNEYGFIDYILIGEYEYTLLELVDHLESKSSLESILGLAHRDGKGVIINSARPTIDNLESLPWPEREDVPIYKYNDGFADLPCPNVQMHSSRGCPFGCTYCLWPQAIYRERRYRKRNPAAVIDEMECLIKKFNFKAVYFDDDVFNIDKNHVLNICQQIKERRIIIPWAAMARPDMMDEETLRSMRRSGLYAIKYGIESASRDVLSLCRKDLDLDKAVRMIKLTQEIGIRVHLTFCLGLPGETKQTIQQTLNFIQETRPDSWQFSFATPFPGTGYFDYMNNQWLLLSKDWSDYDGNYKCIIKTRNLSNNDLEKMRITLINNPDFNPMNSMEYFIDTEV